MGSLNSLSSLASSSSTATFNGTSQYAGDLQQAISHAVAVASIPLSELEDNTSTLQSESSELTTIQGDFTNIQTAIQQLSSATGTGSLSATLSRARMLAGVVERV